MLSVLPLLFFWPLLTTDLADSILLLHIRSHLSPHLNEVSHFGWYARHDCQPSRGNRCLQACRSPLIAHHLLDEAENSEERSRLLAVSTRESGVWLRVLPVSGLGLRINNNTIRVAVGL